MAVQQTKASELTDRLNSLASQSGRLSTFEAHAVKREIEKVKQASLPEYYMLLGMLYSIAGEYQKSVESHRKSIAQLGDMVDYANFGLSLMRLGRSDEAIAQLLRAFEMSVVRDSFSDLLRAMMFAGDFSFFDHAVELFSKYHPETDVSQNNTVRSIVQIRNALSLACVPEAEYRSAMGLVERLVTDNGYRMTAALVQSGSFDGVQHVYAELHVAAVDAKALVCLNDMIASAIIESDFTSWDRMVFNAVYCPDLISEDVFHVA